MCAFVLHQTTEIENLPQMTFLAIMNMSMVSNMETTSTPILEDSLQN